MQLADADLAAARSYVDEQLATMRKHGSEPKLSRQRYRHLVREVAKTTVKLRAKYEREKRCRNT